MNKECDIVQDLLFGYKDKTLHQRSKELVERHLKNCENCKSIYEEITKVETEEKKEQKQEIDYLKKVKNKIGKKNKLILIISIILISIILLNVGIFIYYYHEAGEMQIFLENEITDEQIEEINKIIKEIDNEAKIEFYSKDDALNNLKEKFKDNKDLLSGYGGDKNPLNAYYVVSTNIEHAKKIESKIENLDGIKKVTGIYDDNPYLFMIQKIMVEN